ncbi:hypothetical protein [Paraglaciecola sp. L3A3]|uniref:hypothetical protein n=1 Tax=Paraglaciecola sp. L3A3 TaxID=2686358 RepID=UPI00131C974B|nr:hypothetical protein [Paraglaciecola sp. L3A3]
MNTRKVPIFLIAFLASILLSCQSNSPEDPTVEGLPKEPVKIPEVPEDPISSDHCANANRVGDPNWVYDESKNDSNFSTMQEWKLAGVEDGIPCKEALTKVATKSVTETDINAFQDIIDNVIIPNNTSSAYILVEEGIHYLDQPLNMKSGIVLRGEDKNNTIIIVRIKHKWQESGSRKLFAINFDDVENSGIENLTIKYQVKDATATYQPLDRNNFDEPNESVPDIAWPFRNDYKVNLNNPDKVNPLIDDSLYVGLVKFDGTTKNSWMQDTVLLESGTDPIWIGTHTRHLTLRYNDIYRCYNKGGEGNCYYDIRGQYILVTNERVRKIRHIAIQQEAKYNVLYQNDFEIDVNFHNGDLGFNLVEQNSIKIPFVHKWHNLATGGIDTHQAPGPKNLLYKNETAHKRSGYNNIPAVDLVYEVITFNDVLSLSDKPKHGTLYPMAFN